MGKLAVTVNFSTSPQHAAGLLAHVPGVEHGRVSHESLAIERQKDRLLEFMLRGVLAAAAHLRREGADPMTSDDILNFAELDNILRLVGDQSPLPPSLSWLLKDYLKRIPGFKPETGSCQGSDVIDAHEASLQLLRKAFETKSVSIK